MIAGSEQEKLILKGLRNKEEQALKSLIDLSRPRVFHTAFSYLKNQSDSEEICIDVFLEVWESIESFKEESSLMTWLLRITINKSLDKLKYQQRKKRFAWLSSLFSLGEDQSEQIPDSKTPQAALEQKEMFEHLSKALEKLPDSQRHAWTLVYLEKLPQQEVAELLSISVGAVESLLQRAKKSLQIDMEGIFERRRKKTKK